jgi:hypothetical protein
VAADAEHAPGGQPHGGQRRVGQAQRAVEQRLGGVQRLFRRALGRRLDLVALRPRAVQQQELHVLRQPRNIRRDSVEGGGVASE